MSYSAPRPTQLLHTLFSHREGAGFSGTIVTNATWPTANLAIYVPFLVPETITVRKLWIGNGTTGTGNVDIGLYTASGVLLVSSGSTAKSTTAEEHVIDVTDTTIGPGIYYVALACSNNTDTFAAVQPAAPLAAAAGLLTEASALPLPATATFALTQSLAFVPVVGIAVTTEMS